ncbi:hypothetical protein EDB89DRAFT_1295241 [Lactarius sanguifluus]|nr:hypothetical protein EDB89DRAFT_1295241 [Lactarius sanguifluus]
MSVRKRSKQAPCNLLYYIYISSLARGSFGASRLWHGRSKLHFTPTAPESASSNTPYHHRFFHVPLGSPGRVSQSFRKLARIKASDQTAALKIQFQKREGNTSSRDNNLKRDTNSSSPREGPLPRINEISYYLAAGTKYIFCHQGAHHALTPFSRSLSASSAGGLSCELLSVLRYELNRSACSAMHWWAILVGPQAVHGHLHLYAVERNWGCGDPFSGF